MLAIAKTSTMGIEMGTPPVGKAGQESGTFASSLKEAGLGVAGGPAAGAKGAQSASAGKATAAQGAVEDFRGIVQFASDGKVAARRGTAGDGKTNRDPVVSLKEPEALMGSVSLSRDRSEAGARQDARSVPPDDGVGAGAGSRRAEGDESPVGAAARQELVAPVTAAPLNGGILKQAEAELGLQSAAIAGDAKQVSAGRALIPPTPAKGPAPLAAGANASVRRLTTGSAGGSSVSAAMLGSKEQSGTVDEAAVGVPGASPHRVSSPAARVGIGATSLKEVSSSATPLPVRQPDVQQRVQVADGTTTPESRRAGKRDESRVASLEAREGILSGSSGYSGASAFSVPSSVQAETITVYGNEAQAAPPVTVRSAAPASLRSLGKSDAPPKEMAGVRFGSGAVASSKATSRGSRVEDGVRQEHIPAAQAAAGPAELSAASVPAATQIMPTQVAQSSASHEGTRSAAATEAGQVGPASGAAWGEAHRPGSQPPGGVGGADKAVATISPAVGVQGTAIASALSSAPERVAAERAASVVNQEGGAADTSAARGHQEHKDGAAGQARDRPVTHEVGSAVAHEAGGVEPHDATIPVGREAGSPVVHEAGLAFQDAGNGSVVAAAHVPLAGPVGLPHAPAPAAAAPTQAGGGYELSQAVAGAGAGENVLPVAHTTLHASATVLEVGVPGGAQGWLKIRAEIGEGGAVQASMTPSTAAGEETLHRELPGLSAFLASEHVPVSIQVGHAMQTGNVAADAAVTWSTGAGSSGNQTAGAGAGSSSGSSGEQMGRLDGGEQQGGRQQASGDGRATGGGMHLQGPEETPDGAWPAAQGYGGSARGGSWLNVMA